MNNTTVINPFNNGKSNATIVNTQHRQIMTTIIDRILKFEPTLKNQ